MDILRKRKPDALPNYPLNLPAKIPVRRPTVRQAEDILHYE